MANLKGIATGALLGTVLGSLAVILYPRRQEILEALRDQTGDLSERARDYADVWINGNRPTSQAHWITGLTGLFLGAGIALSLAPKTGKQFRSQLVRIYDELFGKTQDVAQFFRHNAHPITTVRTRVKKKAKRLIRTTKH